MNVELQIKDDAIKIFVNNTIHICINQKQFLGVQSWVTNNRWYIEFYCKGNKKILCEYDSIKKWNKILSLLSKHNLFNKNL